MPLQTDFSETVPALVSTESVLTASFRLLLLPAMVLGLIPVGLLGLWLVAWVPALEAVVPWLLLLAINCAWIWRVALPIGRAQPRMFLEVVVQMGALGICLCWQLLFSYGYWDLFLHPQPAASSWNLQGFND
jgi:hypothetical protein